MSLILGLDVSSSVIGWALVSYDAGNVSLVKYGNVKPMKSSKGSLCARISDTFDIISELCKDIDPDAVAVESYASKFTPGRSTARTIIVLSVFNELVSMASFRSIDIEPKKYAVSTIRSCLSKVSQTKIISKEETFDFILKTFENFSTRLNRNGNIKKECYDEADAIAVCVAYIVKECDHGEKLNFL
tara:strand:+ start:1133 stop:1693 length:561 start_codon:yes stop_codon:yes gene_type:complete